MFAEGCVKLPSLPEGEITAIEVHRANPYVELGISIVGGNETPLINIVIQEVYRDGVIARDGRLLAGDQILQVAGKNEIVSFKCCIDSVFCCSDLKPTSCFSPRR